jgi:hypothetical protein
MSKERKNDVEAINIRRLHLVMRNLDQDKIQLTQIIGAVTNLCKKTIYSTIVKKATAPENRDWL